MPMKRRTFLQQASAACAAELALPHTFPAAPETPPNILFVFSDQQRWDTVGCYGENTLGRALNLTPNLDAVAAEGVRFQHAFSPQPLCGPSRACLQSGLYATQTGCWRNNRALPLDAVTLPRLLKPAGYQTGYIGKWHLASDGERLNLRTKAVPLESRGGYDEFWLASDALEFTSHGYDGHLFDAAMNQVDFPPGRYRVDALTDYAIDFLQKRDKARPFFLFLSYLEPHHQNDHSHFEGPTGSKERYKNYPVPGDLEGKDGDWREEMPDYLGCCAKLDESVGRLRRTLETLGIAESTLVVYTSDHACHFRTREGEYKRSCHENSIHVPLIIRGPGFRGGRVQQELVSLIDLPRTLLAAAHQVAPAKMQGRPLQDLVQSQEKEWRNEVFVQISESHIGRAIRTPQWKYSVRAPETNVDGHGGSKVYVEDFLYRLDTDPYERTNSAAAPAHADTRVQLRARLVARMLEAGEPAPEILPAKT
jgi:arylsulfatase A-like enzyme